MNPSRKSGLASPAICPNFHVVDESICMVWREYAEVLDLQDLQDLQ